MRAVRKSLTGNWPAAGFSRCVLGVLVLALWLAQPVTAEFYRYTDANGQVHFVDDPGQIPASRLGTMKVYKETPNPPPVEPERSAPEGVNAIAPTPQGGAETPVIVRGNRVLVPVTIGYRGREVETLLLLDTGASLTILHQSIARQVMLTGTANREAVVVGGSRIPVRMAQVAYIQVGPYRIPRAQVAIIRHEGPQLEHHGLLGMNILRALDYSLDIDRRVLVWNQ